MIGFSIDPLDLFRFNSNFIRLSNQDCWIWHGGTNDKGYGFFDFATGERQYAHRVAFQIAHPEMKIFEKENLLCVLHSCDNPPCVNVSHLWLGTNKDNVNDCIAKGRHGLGEKNSFAKLTELKVQEIRYLASLGLPHKEIALRFDVSVGAVRDVIYQRTWKII